MAEFCERHTFSHNCVGVQADLLAEPFPKGWRGQYEPQCRFCLNPFVTGWPMEHGGIHIGNWHYTSRRPGLSNSTYKKVEEAGKAPSTVVFYTFGVSAFG